MPSVLPWEIMPHHFIIGPHPSDKHFFLPILVCFCVHTEKDVSFIILSDKRGCAGVCFVATIVNPFPVM